MNAQSSFTEAALSALNLSALATYPPRLRARAEADAKAKAAQPIQLLSSSLHSEPLTYICCGQKPTLRQPLHTMTALSSALDSEPTPEQLRALLRRNPSKHPEKLRAALQIYEAVNRGELVAIED
jgi:hypothetical protein